MLNSLKIMMLLSVVDVDGDENCDLLFQFGREIEWQPNYAEK